MRVLRVSILLAAVCGGAISGCGGKVVLDSPGGTGGATSTSGSGNAGGTTSTSSPGNGGGASVSGAGGSTSTDPICLNPNAMVSEACINCVDALLSGSAPCFLTFTQACEGDTSCVAYGACITGCEHKTSGQTGGAGGGSTACAAADGMGGSGGAATNCQDCCVNSNATGATVYVTDSINACICAAGAPCGSACAM